MLNKIETAAQQIDERISHYTKPLYFDIVKALQPDQALAIRAEDSLVTTLHMARFVDLHFETGDPDFLTEARRLESELYIKLPGATADLERIKNETLGFFDIEKDVWTKVQSGQTITDEEFEAFRLGKSSDARYYARVVQEFAGRDVTKEIYTDMQLMDILADIREFEADMREKNPNLLYMLLSQKVPLGEIPETQPEAVQLARSLGIYEKLLNISEYIIEKAQDFDYEGIEFVKEGSEGKLAQIEKELGENPIIRKGLRYLLHQQLQSGEFPTYTDNDPEFSNVKSNTNVFNTAVILHALLPFKNIPRVQGAVRKSLEWLMSQQDNSGYWNFFGKSVHDLTPAEQVPPDVDGTSYILSVLKDWNVTISNSPLEKLLKNRNDQGLFITWIPNAEVWWDADVEAFVDREEVDPVVNANALHMCYQYGIEIPEIDRYLEGQIVSKKFHKPSNYYLSDSTFLYAVSRLIKFNPKFVQEETGRICRERIFSILEESSSVTPLELAMTLSAGLNGFMPYSDSRINNAIAHLESIQDKDGGWGTYPFYKGYLSYYGSRGLTTALVIATMSLQ